MTKVLIADAVRPRAGEVFRTRGLAFGELPQTKNKLDLLNYEFLHERNLLFGTPDFVVNKIKEICPKKNLT